jgi:hypothetical protein
MRWLGWVGIVQISLIVLGAAVGWVLGTVLNMFPFVTFGKWPTLKDQVRGAIEGALFVGAILFVADGMVAASPYGHRGYIFVVNRFGLLVAGLLIAAVVLVFGVIAYSSKKGYPRAYGVVEVVFAVALAFVTAGQLSNPAVWTATMMGLGGCVYVVSRGIGNYTEASKKLRQKSGTQREEKKPE